MITTTRLHRHDYDLLPEEAVRLFSAIVNIMRNNSDGQDSDYYQVKESTTMIGKFSITEKFHIKPSSYHNFNGSNSINGSVSGSGANGSGSEIIDIVEEQKKNVEKVFVPSAEIVLVCVYALLMAWGIVSNSLVCFVVTKQCSRKTITSNGPSPRNLYIVNLAIADFLLCIICMPFTLVSLLRRRWSMGILLCKLVPVAQGANIIVSSGTIAAIAFDRYFTIVRSPRGPMCRCSVATTLILIWFISLASLLPTCLYQHMEVLRIGEITLYEICVEKWPSTKLQRMYTILLATLQFAVPVLALSTIHVKISMYLNVHLSTAKPSTDFSKRANRELRRNRKTMWILSCIAIVFAVSWLPLTIFTLIVEFKPSLFPSSDWLYFSFCVCHVIAMSSAGTNPLLYGYLNTNFRRDLTSLLYSVFRIKSGSVYRKEQRKILQEKITDGAAALIKEGKSATTNHEAVSIVVRSRDRRTSSSFGTTLTSVLRGRSSSFGLTQHKIDEI